jgi:hypothetical protein
MWVNYVAEVGKQVEKPNASVFEQKDSSLRIESITNRLNVPTVVLVVLTMTQLGLFLWDVFRKSR